MENTDMEKQQIYDVAIIGLGPAGSTLARLLREDIKVVAIDKKIANSHKSFRKPCGGLLSPDAQKAVSCFGLVFPKDILVSPQIFAVKTIDLKQKLIRHYQRFYFNFDRHRFDLWLMSLIPSWVDVVTGAVCRSIKSRDGYYIIKYKKDGKITSLKARCVVGADGAASKTRRALFPGFKAREYTAIQQWFLEENPKPCYSAFFDSGITDCYGWGISKDGYFIIGGAFPKKFARKRFEALKKKTAKWGFSYGEPVRTEACAILRPKGLFNICTGENNAFFIGEAAGFISPSSLEGISYAFDSARELAKVLNSGCKHPNKQYKRATFKIRAKIFLKSIKSLIIYTPFIRKIVMKSGIQNIKVPGF